METKLWYESPAKSFSEALPLGNGNLGAMVYGGYTDEKILLNSDTLWSGGLACTSSALKSDETKGELLSQVRELIFSGRYFEAEQIMKQKMLGTWTQSYVSMGSLHIRYRGQKGILNYYRELDMAAGVVSSAIKTQERKIKEEIFVSAADHAVILRIQVQGSPLSMEIDLQSKLKNTVEISEGALIVRGEAPGHVEPNYVVCDQPVRYDDKEPGLRFCLCLAVKESDGRVEMREGSCRIQDANHVILVITAQNGYRGYDKEPEASYHLLKEECLSYVRELERRSYKQWKKHHREIHGSMFHRVSFTLHGDKEYRKLPLNKRLAIARKQPATEPIRDRGLIELLFQYGRYLLISSSRDNGEFTQPANLQGIWCGDVRPVWSSNYTTNINLEMNYWLSGVCNLSECDLPLIRMLEELKQAGTKTAKEYFQASGFVVNHNTDLWRQTQPVGGEVKYAFWPMAGIWLCSHLYQHYLYTEDLLFLQEKALPIMKEAIGFCLDWLIQGKNGFLSTCPSTSPENTFLDEQGRECGVSYSSTMDMALIKELFHNFMDGCHTLMKESLMEEAEKEAFEKIRQDCEKVLCLLPDYRIGKHGQLQEWIEDFEEADTSHRHLAHLAAFHPFAQINKNDTPDLIPAVRKVLERRTAGQSRYIGWNQAWLVLFYARLEDSNQAGCCVNQMLKHSVYNNLLDLHPPLGEGEGEREIFQIDGNLGISCGIAEMLLQSHLGTISLLPALPKTWAAGQISGLKARGNVEVSLEWKNHTLTKAWLRLKRSRDILLEYTEKVNVCDGEFPVDCSYEKRQYADMPDKIITVFQGAAGKLYSIGRM